MRKLLALAALFVLMCVAPRGANAQAAIAVPACGATTVQTGINGLNQPLQINAQGLLCDTGGSSTGSPGAPGYQPTPVASSHQNLTLTTSTALTVPGTANFAIGECLTANCSYCDDGTTPTTTSCLILSPGTYVTFYGQTEMTAVRLYPAGSGAIFAVQYYK